MEAAKNESVMNMLPGKILQDGSDYHVKVGGVTIDITDDVRALIAQAITEQRALEAKLRVDRADILERYRAIQRIVLAGGVGMPTG